ncbi:MAG: nucleotide pyrophosphohydrolase [Gammaproteobacteria bacterium HGW-Gammaproteobacteria-6]|nr:MAG: nucleotide pyrophosphohydrolase [Gammaproteobacteria bacterium HGW-Gammaproteobacteria-6]
MSEIKLLTEQVLAFRDERDWKQFHNSKDLALSLVLEATEVLEIFQWKQDMADIDGVATERKQDLADELADVFCYTLLMANDLGIDLGKALEAKIEKNNAKYPVDKAKGSDKKYTEL